MSQGKVPRTWTQALAGVELGGWQVPFTWQLADDKPGHHAANAAGPLSTYTQWLCYSNRYSSLSRGAIIPSEMPPHFCLWKRSQNVQSHLRKAPSKNPLRKDLARTPTASSKSGFPLAFSSSLWCLRHSNATINSSVSERKTEHFGSGCSMTWRRDSSLPRVCAEVCHPPLLPATSWSLSSSMPITL